MKTITLADGTLVPHIAFGSGTALLRRDCSEDILLALKAGFTHIDTAQRYGNEEYVGQAITTFLSTQSDVKRSDLFVSTKFMTLEEGESVEDSLRGSLTRLGLEYVDSFLIHAPVGYVPNGLEKHEDGIKGVWKKMVEMKKEGLTKTIGVSNFNKKQLEEILSIGLEPPAINQVRRMRVALDRVLKLADLTDIPHYRCITDRIPSPRRREARASPRLFQSARNCHKLL